MSSGNTPSSNPNTSIDDQYADDPDPIAADASEADKMAYVSLLNGYSNEMLQCFKNSTFSGEALWIEFTF